MSKFTPHKIWSKNYLNDYSKKTQQRNFRIYWVMTQTRPNHKWSKFLAEGVCKSCKCIFCPATRERKAREEAKNKPPRSEKKKSIFGMPHQVWPSEIYPRACLIQNFFFQIRNLRFWSTFWGKYQPHMRGKQTCVGPSAAQGVPWKAHPGRQFSR